MRLHSLRLSNFKLLADQEFSFLREDGSVRKWTVLLGDNGVCKTSILQAIAIAASGDKVARALVKDAAEYVNAGQPDRPTDIEASFDVPDASSPETICLSVRPEAHSFSGCVDVSREQDIFMAFLNATRDTRKSGYLTVGYGVGRRLPKAGEVSIPLDPITDRVTGLFDSHHKVLGIDFFDALSDADEALGRAFAQSLRDALLAEDQHGNRLLPWLSNLELRGRGGVDTMKKLLESRRILVEPSGSVELKLSPHQLSQGYQSTIAWIADLLGHAFLDAKSPVDPTQLRGIVLLDEIDLHLHPTWQRRIVPILKQTFPELQFVVTTHSPLVLTGFEANEIIKLELRDGEIVQRAFEIEPGMQTSTELIETYFDVPTAARPELAEKEERLVELMAKRQRLEPAPAAGRPRSPRANGGLTPEEDRKLERLERELGPYLRSSQLARMDLAFEGETRGESTSEDLWRQGIEALRRTPTK